MNTQETRFNYTAFSKEITNKPFGVRKVANECLKNKYHLTKDKHFESIVDKIHGRYASADRSLQSNKSFPTSSLYTEEVSQPS